MAIWFILWSFGIFYSHLVYFVAIWHILWSFGIFYSHLVYFVAIWHILWSFGIFYGHLAYFVAIWYIFTVLVCCIKKNLATLNPTKVMDDDMKHCFVFNCGRPQSHRLKGWPGKLGSEPRILKF
jgi:hypothetical protein